MFTVDVRILKLIDEYTHEYLLIRAVAYHVRYGGHDVTAYDWKQYLNFTDRWLKHTASPLQ